MSSRIQLNANNEVTLGTRLSKGQISKFNALQDNLVIKNGTAYVSTDELHGVLLTRGRKDARAIIRNYQDTLRIYFVDPEDLGIETIDAPDYIRPVGLYILLEQLAEDRPQRARDYRASHALLACIVAGNAQLTMHADQLAAVSESSKRSVIRQVKSAHTACQISGHVFGKGDEKHVHHIEPEFSAPALAADKNNLIVIAEQIHHDYHGWIDRSPELEINRGTLRNFCRRNQYSLEWDAQA